MGLKVNETKQEMKITNTLHRQLIPEQGCQMLSFSVRGFVSVKLKEYKWDNCCREGLFQARPARATARLLALTSPLTPASVIIDRSSKQK